MIATSSTTANGRFVCQECGADIHCTEFDSSRGTRHMPCGHNATALWTPYKENDQ